MIMIDYDKFCRKNVLCELRVGCCCGWNNVLKFQKLKGKIKISY